MKAHTTILHACILFLSFYLFSISSFAQSISDNSFTAKNLGSDINSKLNDYAPCISKDGLTLYYVTQRSTSRDRIYIAKRKNRDSPWSEGSYYKISNNQDRAGGMTLDQIGRFYFSTNRESAGGNFNIWEGFGLDSIITVHALPPPLNTVHWESQPSVTKDGNDLYFVSNRESKGGSVDMLVDIFVSHRTEGDHWSEPKNLGHQINFSTFNGTPFISPDGHFLFFTATEKKGTETRRHIYMSERIGSNDIDWSEPIRLPAPINSEKDEMFPMIANDGKTIYFSSTRDEGKGLDIYETTLPEDIQNKIFHSFSGY